MLISVNSVTGFLQIRQLFSLNIIEYVNSQHKLLCVYDDACTHEHTHINTRYICIYHQKLISKSDSTTLFQQVYYMISGDLFVLINTMYSSGDTCPSLPTIIQDRKQRITLFINISNPNYRS